MSHRWDMSPDARALLDAARSAEHPPTGDKARLRRTLMAAIAAGGAGAAATAGASTAAAASGAASAIVAKSTAAVGAGGAVGATATTTVGTAAVGTAAVGSTAVAGGAALGGGVVGGGALGAVGSMGMAKVAAAMLFVGVAGGVGVASLEQRFSEPTTDVAVHEPERASDDARHDSARTLEPSARTSVADELTLEDAAFDEAIAAELAPALVVEAPVVEAPVVEAPVAAAVVEPARPRARVRAVARDVVGEPAVAHAVPIAPPVVAEPVALAATLPDELRLLRAAQSSLRDGDALRALVRLDEHQRRFPTGALAEERDAARVLALCEAGLDADADAARATFLSEHASSPLAPRVRRSCSE